MKYEIIQKNGKADSSCFLRVIIAGAVLIFALSVPPHSYPQLVRSYSTLTMKSLKSQYGLNNRQLNQLRPLIESRAGNLYKILYKYMDENELSFVPFWADTDIWFDLQNLRQQPLPNLTKSQRRAFLAANSVMEKEVLLTLIDEQLLAMGDELELDSYQVEYLNNILVGSIRKNRLLINKPQTSPDALKKRLELISNQTEKKIGNVLFADQLEKYRKQKQKMQQDVSFANAVASTIDVPQSAKFSGSETDN